MRTIKISFFVFFLIMFSNKTFGYVIEDSPRRGEGIRQIAERHGVNEERIFQKIIALNKKEGRFRNPKKPELIHVGDNFFIIVPDTLVSKLEKEKLSSDKIFQPEKSNALPAEAIKDVDNAKKHESEEIIIDNGKQTIPYGNVTLIHLILIAEIAAIMTYALSRTFQSKRLEERTAMYKKNEPICETWPTPIIPVEQNTSEPSVTTPRIFTVANEPKETLESNTVEIYILAFHLKTKKFFILSNKDFATIGGPFETVIDAAMYLKCKELSINYDIEITAISDTYRQINSLEGRLLAFCLREQPPRNLMTVHCVE